MTLLDAPAEKPAKSRAMAFTVSAVVIIAIVALWFTFRFYPEKKVAQNFFNTLVAGDTSKAYELWKPSPSYALKDFLADWGPQGYYGPVKSYEIVKASSPHGTSSSVIVEVRISPFSPMPDESDADKSRKTRVISVWVDSRDKSFSFPP